MSAMYWVGAALSFAIFIYLLYALFKPEKF
jgi:K+-transporting ATPase KdpF subunit